MAKNKGKHGENHGCCDPAVDAKAAPAGTSASCGEPRGHDGNDRIGRRAYEIWEAEERPAGRALDHWLMAEKEVNGEKPDAP